jgi:serine/threonine-protein kinase PknK
MASAYCWRRLQAQLLYIETVAAGREADARDELAPVTDKFAELGLSRLPVNAVLV